MISLKILQLIEFEFEFAFELELNVAQLKHGKAIWATTSIGKLL